MAKRKKKVEPSPFPWRHHNDTKTRITAILDANGNIVAGSLLCSYADYERTAANHALIMHWMQKAKLADVLCHELAKDGIVT